VFVTVCDTLTTLTCLSLQTGMQLLGKALGGTVSAAAQGEFGPMNIRIMDPTDKLFSGVMVDRVWMSHGDEVR
jgi:GMP synthase-like glutamine amidotransferase